MHAGYKCYQDVSVKSEALSASPHRLVQMLFEGCLQRIAIAKVNIEQKNVSEKIRNITKAIDIVIALRCNLADKTSNPISQQLDALYEFVERHLMIANLKNSPVILDEAYRVIANIKAGWDAIEEKEMMAAYNE
jgi:flagellar secretion chaperone FliS